MKIMFGRFSLWLYCLVSFLFHSLVVCFLVLFHHTLLLAVSFSTFTYTHRELEYDPEHERETRPSLETAK